MAARIDARRWRRLSDPVPLGELDFATSDLVAELTGVGIAGDRSERTGVMMFFELPLTPSISFTQDPHTGFDAEDWPCPVWITPHLTVLERGDRFRVSYRRAGSSLLSLERANDGLEFSSTVRQPTPQRIP